MRGTTGALAAMCRRLSAGRIYRMPAPVLVTLEAVFEAPVDSVEVIEHSAYARAHLGMSATTRRDLILLSISGDAFIADPELVLHEYFHVMRQWNTGALTRRRYIVESLRRGYRANQFEVDARAFAASKLVQYCAGLRRAC